MRLLAHEAQRAAEATIADARADPGRECKNAGHQRQKGDCIPRASKAIEQRGDGADAVGAAGQPALVGGNRAQNFGHRQRGDAPVVGRELAAYAGHEQSEQHGRCKAESKACQGRPAELESDASGVGPEACKCNVAKIQQTRIARLQIEPQGHQRIDTGDGEG
ncbi:hypothetical protein SDC9_185171 [bioreactor metagenome]|uniref:Uncharacterized protein n=1 Tax=bioreactor metagenome TaxID=1076179 RepID=A0A645HF67_9ZZZZ